MTAAVAIRLRRIGTVLVAICAAKSIEKPGDIYLDDEMHHALSTKFALDFNSERLESKLPYDSFLKQLMDQEEDNNSNRDWWNTIYGNENNMVNNNPLDEKRYWVYWSDGSHGWRTDNKENPVGRNKLFTFREARLYAKYLDGNQFGVFRMRDEEPGECYWVPDGQPIVIYENGRVYWGEPKFKVGDRVIPTSPVDRAGFSEGYVIDMIEFRPDEGYIYWEMTESRHYDVIRGCGFAEQYLELYVEKENINDDAQSHF